MFVYISEGINSSDFCQTRSSDSDCDFRITRSYNNVKACKFEICCTGSVREQLRSESPIPNGHRIRSSMARTKKTDLITNQKLHYQMPGISGNIYVFKTLDQSLSIILFYSKSLHS